MATKKSQHVVKPLEGMVDVRGQVPHVNVTWSLVVNSVKVVVDLFGQRLNLVNICIE